MELATQKKISLDNNGLFITERVKEIVHYYDMAAEVILFGSRARGDWHEESDWDFFVLSSKENIEELAEKIRRDVLNKIELVSFESVFILVKNKKMWEEDYSVTGLYKSLEEEGIKL